MQNYEVLLIFEGNIHSANLKTISKLFIFSTFLMMLSSCGKQSLEEKAQSNALNYILEKRRDILVLDSAEFSPLQPILSDSTIIVAESKPVKKVKPAFTISYFTIRQRKKGMIQIPVMAQLRFDSAMNVIDLELHERKN